MTAINGGQLIESIAMYKLYNINSKLAEFDIPFPTLGSLGRGITVHLIVLGPH
jgi:hypothetical protein